QVEPAVLEKSEEYPAVETRVGRGLPLEDPGAAAQIGPEAHVGGAEIAFGLGAIATVEPEGLLRGVDSRDAKRALDERVCGRRRIRGDEEWEKSRKENGHVRPSCR